MINKVPITQEGLEKLRRELKNLITIERPNNIKAIAEARAHGDLSENAEYHAAKERQSFLEGKINELEDAVSRSEVVEIDENKTAERIVFGTTVKIKKTDPITIHTNRFLTYQLVGPYESDPENNKISVFSPLGKALIGKEEFDIVDIEMPNGIQMQFEVLEIK